MALWGLYMAPETDSVTSVGTGEVLGAECVQSFHYFICKICMLPL